MDRGAANANGLGAAVRWLFLIAGLLGSNLGYAEDRETRLRAAFLYRLAFFVEWPAGRFVNAESPVVMCLDSRVAPVLIKELAQIGDRESRHFRVGKGSSRSNLRPLQVRLLGEGRGSTDCHLLYGETLDPQTSANQVLVVVGTLEALKVTGGLALVREQRSEGDARLVFFAHKQRLQDSSIKLSSKLLQLVRFYEPS